MNVLEALRRLNAYPIPLSELQSICIVRALDADSDATAGVLKSADFKRATADVYLWLSEAPNVSQDGISYSFSEEQRKGFKRRAAVILNALGDDGLSGTEVTYGYKGSRL